MPVRRRALAVAAVALLVASLPANAAGPAVAAPSSAGLSAPAVGLRAVDGLDEVVGVTAAVEPAAAGRPDGSGRGADRPPTAPVDADRPLAGVVIALDPGHQLGNSNPRFASELARTRWNGTIVKACNTTGTATNRGYPEATFTWKVATRLKERLESLGAVVPLTRTANSWNLWGPCTWNRGRFGGEVGADLEVSIHADGAAPGGRGFFVIAPGYLEGWTDDIARPSQRLAKDMIAGMKAAGAQPSTYISGSMLVWKDQNTLNFADVPTVIVEVGNMRNASDAARMVTAQGQQRYADWLLAGIRRHLGR